MVASLVKQYRTFLEKKKLALLFRFRRKIAERISYNTRYFYELKLRQGFSIKYKQKAKQHVSSATQLLP
jgi:hypothetical protein